MGTSVENTGLQLSDLKVSNLPELQGWKEKQEKLVADNPFVEITDNKTYTVACQSRTALLKGRTELEKQDKLVASKLTAFRKDVKTETDTLIAITLPSEEKQQTEVKRYEGIKEAERLEKERIEKERVDGIKAKIEAFETDSYRIIQETKFKNVELHKTMLDAFVNAEFDYEEYDVLFEQARERVQASWDAKCTDIQEKEEQRLKNEQLEKENAEAKRLSDLQASRLNEILPYVAFGEAVDLTKLSGIEESAYSGILASKKALFEADAKEKKEAQDKLDADNLERENKAKAEKEKIFEIRKGRLVEIGIVDGGNFFENDSKTIKIVKEVILDSDAIDFETLITDAKLDIEKVKSDVIKEIADKRKLSFEEAGLIIEDETQIYFPKTNLYVTLEALYNEISEERFEAFLAEFIDCQKEKDLELSKADAERLKKENKARVKRLAGDKKQLLATINSISYNYNAFTLENEESKSFLEIILNRVEGFRDELLTELEKL